MVANPFQTSATIVVGRAGWVGHRNHYFHCPSTIVVVTVAAATIVAVIAVIAAIGETPKAG